MSEETPDRRIPYRETVVLRGPVRGGELHAAHPDVVAFILRHPTDRQAPVCYVRGRGPEMADDEGRSVFLQEELIEPDLSNVVEEFRRRRR
jgi:hypothetical protein